MSVLCSVISAFKWAANSDLLVLKYTSRNARKELPIYQPTFLFRSFMDSLKY